METRLNRNLSSLWTFSSHLNIQTRTM